MTTVVMARMARLDLVRCCGVRAPIETRASRPAGAAELITREGLGLIRGEIIFVELFFYRAIGLIAYNLNIGIAIHLAAGGYYPIGRALGLRLTTVCSLAADRLVWYGLYFYTMCKIWYDGICEGGFAGRHC